MILIYILESYITFEMLSLVSLVMSVTNCQIHLEGLKLLDVRVEDKMETNTLFP